MLDYRDVFDKKYTSNFSIIRLTKTDLLSDSTVTELIQLIQQHAILIKAVDSA